VIRALYITGDVVGAPGGAGAVTKNELQVLTERYGADQVSVLQLADVRPQQYAALDIPFLWDYFALTHLATLAHKPLEHAHFYSGCYSETVRVLKARGVKVTYTSPHHDRAASLAERGAAYYLPHIDDSALWAQHVEGLKLADLVIAPSTHSRDSLLREGVERITIIPHGIEHFPEEVAPFPQEFTVGYLGGLGPDKGLRYLVEAWGKLDLKDARLLIGGAGSEQLEDFIRRHADGGRFNLVGWAANASDFYNGVSCYVQPSVAEGFGCEVPEAMAHGRPVIASKGAGASDCVTESAGYVVKAASADALAEALGRCYKTDTAQLQAMGLRARERAREYTWDRVRARYRQVFETVCRSS